MKLFERTPGYWLFYIGASYLLVGMWSIYKGADITWLPPLFIFFLAMPFWFPPLGRAINLDVTWDRNMIDFFKKKDTDNVVKFPEPKSYPKMPEVDPPEPETVGKTYYRLGLTDNNRVSFTMGYTEITMNREGVQAMIDQLTFYRDQLGDEE